jgi:amidohydrolase
MKGVELMKDQWKKYLSFIEKYEDVILKCERDIWANPEIGYKEWKTTVYMENLFEGLGYSLTKAGNIPGFIADLDSGRPGPKVALIGELDSLICATHPEADKETQAVHACGHNCQCATLLGAAIAFSQKNSMEGLSGSIRFIAVPAEETIDLEYRNKLIKDGIIKYVAGKVEFLHRGLFDGVDMAIMIHTDTNNEKMFGVLKGSDGCITKHFEFEGKASHAGVSPHLGINALYAASLGIQACNSLRETFEERDFIRFHPIITQAGVAVNAIPDLAKMDAYVRGATFEKMVETNTKINRALAGSAASLGANVHIMDTPGNMPLHCSKDINELYEYVIIDLFGEGQVYHGDWQTLSCDMGDISTLMPAVQTMASGASGSAHGKDFYITNPIKACVNPSKIMACMVHELLCNDAALAIKIKEGYNPIFNSKEEYFNSINTIQCDRRAVKYNEDGSIIITN